jgi:alkylglycerol monooxygenase
MESKYIEMAIPFFFLFIGIEVLVNFIKKKKYYSFKDSVNDLSCGITQQIVGVFINLTLYIFLYNNFHLFNIPLDSTIAWILCFIGVDIGYYWYHRMSHEVSIIWGSHVAHHQSEEYNLTVALRQGAFEQYFSAWFYLPLALLGFPPVMFFANHQFNSIYQFFVHTRLINKLGPIELIFTTPSHHRVHHGKNPIYIDRNYSGVFIIWDRLFGSFQKEEEEVVYGTVKPLKSWNPIWANFENWVNLAKIFYRTQGLSNKFKLLIMNPGWQPGEQKFNIPDVNAVTYEKYKTEIPQGLNIYAFIQFLTGLGITLTFLKIHPQLTLGNNFIIALISLISLLNVGAVFEAKKWVLPLEIGKYLLISSFVLYQDWALNIKMPVVLALSIMLFWFLGYRSVFIREDKTMVLQN